MASQTPPVEYRLLAEFRRIFEGGKYLHRASTQGDAVAMQLYEDLLATYPSSGFAQAVRQRDRVLNVQNRQRGVEARRGDGTFGRIIPGVVAIADPGYSVARGPIATVEIGVEVKILAKAMVKQIDRVTNDLRNQVAEFHKGGGDPICAACVGVNRAERYRSYEGRRAYPTTGKGGYLHPCQEAGEAESRLLERAKPDYDEFLLLRFRASNEPPYPFEWVDFEATKLDYAAILARVGSEFQRRF